MDNNTHSVFVPFPILIKDLGMAYPTKNSIRKKRYGIYKCPFCFVNFIANTEGVKCGNIKSCGCYRRSIKLTHGLKDSKLYSVWQKMKDRCYNPNHESYKNYGGRGISVFYKWRNNFKEFYDWCILNGWKEGLKLDRKDNDKNYTPYNCRFVNVFISNTNTRLIRANNTSGFRGVSFNAKRKKWVSQIKSNGIHRFLGYFDTPQEAATRYNKFIAENKTEHPLNKING